MAKAHVVFLLAACCVTSAGQTRPAVAGPSEQKMPPEKAEATFKDKRVIAFLQNVNDGFKVSCTAPDPAQTTAKFTPPPPIPAGAPPDAVGFASTFYEVSVPCTGDTTVTVNAEFTVLTGDVPQTLRLSFSQVLKR